MMNTNRFNKALNRYLRNEMPADEKVQFDKWLDSLSSEEKDLAINWADANQAEVLQKIKSKMNNTNKHNIQLKKSGYRWLKVAASVTIVLCAALWYFIPRINSPTVRITEYSQIEIRKTHLNDGTIVWLKGDSKLSYTESNDGSQRLATLSGEGLFEVAKDPTRPFFVQCGEVMVKVLGTSFSLKTNANTVELKVLTGKVNISSTTNPGGMMVEPKQKVIYSQKNLSDKMPLSQDERTSILGIEEYTMEFTNVPMKEILMRIEKKFDVRVTLKDSQLMQCKLTADFTDHSLEGTLQMLSEVLEMKYEIKDGSIFITGRGCQ